MQHFANVRIVIACSGLDSAIGARVLIIQTVYLPVQDVQA